MDTHYNITTESRGYSTPGEVTADKLEFMTMLVVLQVLTPYEVGQTAAEYGWPVETNPFDPLSASYGGFKRGFDATV